MSLSKHKILYIDDEEENLHSFKAAFRKDFDIITCKNPVQSLELAEEHPDLKVVVSDQKMPGMSGVEFFRTLQVKYPDPVRILLTAYTDLNAVIDANNIARVYQFINKPWNEDELRLSLHNATEMYTTRNQLAEKNKSLQIALEELDHFVYSTSHELRSPITTIKSVLHLLEIAPEEIAEQLPNLNILCDKLDEYILNIIQFYQGERSDTCCTQIHLETFVKSISGELKIFADLNKVSLRYSIPQDLYFNSDPVRLSLILRNLIHNGIKYCDDFKPDKIVIVGTTADKDNIYINIKDNGTGIQKETEDKLFEMFQRTNAYKNGTGLGLYIVSKCVKQLKGSIRYTTSKKGSCFFIKIPNNNDHT